MDERIPIGLIGHNRRVLLIQGLSVRGRPVLEALGGLALHAADLPHGASFSAAFIKSGPWAVFAAVLKWRLSAVTAVSKSIEQQLRRRAL